LFVPDAFTNPAHLHFALKVTFAAMFCYIFYSAIDWSGIHTAFITCTFIALESTEATLYKGTLRIVGCLIGGALALFSIVFLIPHMETIASLVILVACAATIAGWAPGIPHHSIMGDRGRGDTPNSSDGVVPYWSSHLQGAQSELIVNSDHGAQYNPQAIREVERILKVTLAVSR
jgi:hypothetical protein